MSLSVQRVLYTLRAHLLCIQYTVSINGLTKPALSEDYPKVYYTAKSLQFQITADGDKAASTGFVAACLHMNFKDDFFDQIT